MLKRTAAATAAALVLAIGGTGTALAANGADDAPGHHQEHGNGNNGKHHHHGRHHHHGKGDDHGKGNEPGDDNGGMTEAPAPEAPPANESGYSAGQRSGSRTPSPPSGL
jgi:hypothetical protein